MAKNFGISLGASIFIAWDDIDVALNEWAKEYFGEHVEATGSRDETSFEVEFTGFRHSDFSKYCKLFDAYDVEKDYAPEEEFETGVLTSTLPASISRRLMYEVLGGHGLVAFGTAIATYDGVFFMENDRFAQKEINRVVEQNSVLVFGLGMAYPAEVNGGTLFIDCWKGDSVEVFLADDGGLMCLLPDEDEPRALRERIQDIEAGDAFLFGDGGSIRTVSEVAHQNFDENDEPWIVYGDDGDCYFEEDVGSVLGVKLRELLAKLPVREEVYYDAPEFPLRNYDDAVRHLCELLNNRDEEIDLDDNWSPLKLDEFIPIFKSENYFGIYCWHNDSNEYYLIDRNNGEHMMVLGDSFEFVGKNTLDCLKDERVLHVANREWLQYLVQFSLENVKGLPESEMGGIAVLESAWREECKKQGGYVMGQPLAERIQSATDRVVQSAPERQAPDLSKD